MTLHTNDDTTGPEEDDPIDARSAETEIPTWEVLTGNYKIRRILGARLAQAPEKDSNVLITGPPGTGKTATALAYIRRRLKNPALFRSDEDHFSAQGEKITDWHGYDGDLYAFVRIDGATETRADIERRVREAIWSGARHTFVLLDEGGEAYNRRVDDVVRPMLSEPTVTTIATAQAFSSHGRKDSREVAEDRYRAFMRRFSVVLKTENPTTPDLLQYLCGRVKAWDIAVDSPETILLLAQKCQGVVGFATRALVGAIEEPGRRLTRDVVLGMSIDPLV